MPNLTIEVFDPAWVSVGPDCDEPAMGSGYGGTPARNARNDQVSDWNTRYAAGDGVWCTGDRRYSGNEDMSTSFSVRRPSTTPWNPLSFPEVGGACTRTYKGFSSTAKDGLFQALNQGSPGYKPDVAESFRRWSVLCSIATPVVGDYLVQVKTNGLGNDRNGRNTDAADAANRFSIRAYSSSDSTGKDALAIAGRERMAIYANAAGATTEFYLARVPSGAAGMSLSVNLFDVGDSTDPGDIQIIKPPDAAGDSFTDCTGTGPRGPTLSNCKFGVTSSSHQGKWQTVVVQIPSNYSCADTDPTKCWVRLKYPYGASANPHDQTTWTASIQGDPVRLVE
jgi:hypothetical protein